MYMRSSMTQNDVRKTFPISSRCVNREIRQAQRLLLRSQHTLQGCSIFNQLCIGVPFSECKFERFSYSRVFQGISFHSEWRTHNLADLLRSELLQDTRSRYVVLIILRQTLWSISLWTFVWYHRPDTFSMWSCSVHRLREKLLHENSDDVESRVTRIGSKHVSESNQECAIDFSFPWRTHYIFDK